MAKYCDICRQTYSVDHDSCPFCEAPALLDRSRPRQSVPVNEATPVPVPGGLTALPASRPARSDLAASVGAGQIEPRAESSDHRDNRKPPQLGPLSNARMLLGQSGDSSQGKAAKDQSGAEIDLGCPVPGGRPGEVGPPSGASFISWTSLIDDRKEFEDDQPEKAPAKTGASARSLLGNTADGAKSATKLSPPNSSARFPIWFYIAAVPIGVLLAFLLKLIL